MRTGCIHVANESASGEVDGQLITNVSDTSNHPTPPREIVLGEVCSGQAFQEKKACSRSGTVLT